MPFPPFYEYLNVFHQDKEPDALAKRCLIPYSTAFIITDNFVFVYELNWIGIYNQLLDTCLKVVETNAI